MGLEQESLDYIPSSKEVDEYTNLLNEEIDRLIKEMYTKTLIPKFEPYEIDYAIKGLNFRKENLMKYFMEGISIIDPTKTFILRCEDSDIDDDLKETMINNKLIRGTFKERMIIKIKKLWYTFKFILFYLRFKFSKNNTIFTNK